LLLPSQAFRRSKKAMADEEREKGKEKREKEKGKKGKAVI
jgi:hypothetical protein